LLSDYPDNFAIDEAPDDASDHNEPMHVYDTGESSGDHYGVEPDPSPSSKRQGKR